jgi:hypothetical protein
MGEYLVFQANVETVRGLGFKHQKHQPQRPVTIDDNLERWQRHTSESAECTAIVFDTAKCNNGWPGASPAAGTLLGAPANVLKRSHP